MRSGRRMTLTCCAAGLVAMVQMTALGAPPASYQTVHWTPQDEYAKSIERTPDGGTISVGTAELQLNQMDIVLIKMDKCGVRQWVRYYSNPFQGGRLRAHSVRVAKDGNYVVAGEIRPSPLPQHEIFLMKVNAVSGAVMWAHAYEGSGFTNLGGTVVRELSGPAGGYVLIGRKFNPPQGATMGAVLITTNAVGTQTSGCVWTDPRFQVLGATSFNDVRQNPTDNSFTVVGWTRRTDATGAGPTELLAMRTLGSNGCGPQRWASVYFNALQNGERFLGESLELAPSVIGAGQAIPAGYVMTGPWQNATGAMLGSCVLRINGLGAPFWMFTTDTFYDAQSIRTNPTKDHILAGEARAPSPIPFFDGSLLRVSPFGSIIWQQILANSAFANSPESGEEAIPMPDGGFAFAAEAQNYFGMKDFWVSKTDSFGSSPAQCDVRITPQQTQVQGNQFIDLVPAQLTPDTFVDIVFTPRQIEMNDVCMRMCGCERPPGAMTLWLPFDEALPGIAANVANPPFAGTDVGGVGVLGTSFVDRSRTYNGATTFTNVPDYATINPGNFLFTPGAGPFTLDAWINPFSSIPTQVVAGKRTSSVGTPRGYQLFISGGTLWGQVGNGVTASNFNSGLAVAGNVWSHVAMVYRPGPLANLQFYVNGVASAAIPVGAAAGNHASPGFPFRVGATNAPTTAYFRGAIDEVEFHRTALPASEIQRIFLAGSKGKCKNSCVAPLTSFCVSTTTSINATFQVCNYTASPTTYTWNLNGLPVGAGCSVTGPVTFTPDNGITATVNPGTCMSIPVVITVPAGMTAATGLTSCYQFTATNNATGETTTCESKMTYTGPICGHWPHLAGVFLPVPSGLSVPLPAWLVNAGNTGLSFPARIRAIGPDMQPDANAISLNGLPPGEPVIRDISLAPNQSDMPTVSVEFAEDDHVGIYTILLEADLDGDGEFEPLAEQTVRNTPNCLADVDDGTGSGLPDGGVTIEDLLFYLEIFDAGDIRADVDDGSGTGSPDGGVTIEDLLYYLQRFDAGC